MDIHLVTLQNTPIFDQLLLEEYLLREESRNFCLVNTGSSKAIVLGISGKVPELVQEDKAKTLALPLIRRYSGGGTVVIDDNTLFVSFICNKTVLPCEAYPEKIMQWSSFIYEEALEIPNFTLKENDFVIGNKKCGGNAQYITKDRFVQHTSFLWDFSPNYMKALLHPKKTPTYRKERAHVDFLCKLKEHLPTKSSLFEKLFSYLKHKYQAIPLDPPAQSASCRISSKYLSFEEEFSQRR